MIAFYTMMVQKYGKDIETVPELYREQVRKAVYGDVEEAPSESPADVVEGTDEEAPPTEEVTEEPPIEDTTGTES